MSLRSADKKKMKPWISCSKKKFMHWTNWSIIKNFIICLPNSASCRRAPTLYCLVPDLPRSSDGKKTSIHTNRLESNSVELIKLCTIFSLNKDLKLLKFPNKGVTKGSEIKTHSKIQTTKIRPVSSSVSIVKVSKEVARKYKTKYKSGVAWKTQG